MNSSIINRYPNRDFTMKGNKEGVKRSDALINNPWSNFSNIHSEEDTGEFIPQDSINLIISQMEKNNEGSKTIVHNGVEIHFTVDSVLGNRIKFGEETPNSNYISMATGYGAIEFDVNNPSAILDCLDLFSPSEVKQILTLITIQRLAMKNIRDMEEDESKVGDAAEEDGSKNFLQSKEENTKNHRLDNSDINKNVWERTEDLIGKLFEDESLLDLNAKPDNETTKGPEDNISTEEAETTSTVVVNPDGSRTLVVTMKIGNIETVTSTEISKPTEFPTTIGEVDEIEGENMDNGFALNELGGINN